MEQEVNLLRESAIKGLNNLENAACDRDRTHPKVSACFQT